MAEVTEFHRKYRPRKLSEYIGNKRIIESTFTFMKKGDRPQVLLLEGNSGCGKTSFARLIAREYLCEDRDPENGACGECDFCKETEHYIETGDGDALMDIVEVDVTEKNGKTDIENLIEEMQAPSLDGNWKIFILDECHLMTQQAQARLLKTIEEPPPKVLICLCTTDADKLLATIKSRCHYHFRVTKPTREELIGLLARVAKAEGYSWDARALSLIATKGNMTPRDSLIELQKVIRECGDVLYDNTVKVLDIISDAIYFEMFEILTKPAIDVFKYIHFLSRVRSTSNMQDFLSGLIAFATRGIYVYGGVNVDGLDVSEIERYSKIFSTFTPDQIVFIISFLTDLRNDEDVESKLLMLGYTGFNEMKGTVGGTDIARDFEKLDEKVTLSSEVKEGRVSANEARNLTETEQKEVVAMSTKPLGQADILSMFNGVKITSVVKDEANK